MHCLIAYKLIIIVGKYLFLENQLFETLFKIAVLA